MANFRHGRFPLASEADLFPFRWIAENLHSFAQGLPFSLTLLAILLAHEFGHYFACRYYGVGATLPFMIPMPSLSGSAGAVIRLRQRVRTRQALLGIGAAGPICGFVVAVLTSALGMRLSVPAAAAPEYLVQLNSPLLFVLLQRVLHPAHLARNGPLLWHPVLFASWIGLLITSLNLIPAGQFDGGHIVFALSPRVHKAATTATMLALVLLTITSFIGWFLWVVMLLVPALRKPMLKDRSPVTPTMKWIAFCTAVVLLLSIVPEPIQHASLLAFLEQHHW
ncbi:MAG: site-2 protease family protein [Acidobacteriaceae bacterium]|nr:site-2 protease family protein [Acidobacteriaceae bacterium]